MSLQWKNSSGDSVSIDKISWKNIDGTTQNIKDIHYKDSNGTVTLLWKSMLKNIEQVWVNSTRTAGQAIALSNDESSIFVGAGGSYYRKLSTSTGSQIGTEFTIGKLYSPEKFVTDANDNLYVIDEDCADGVTKYSTGTSFSKVYTISENVADIDLDKNANMLAITIVGSSYRGPRVYTTNSSGVYANGEWSYTSTVAIHGEYVYFTRSLSGENYIIKYKINGGTESWEDLATNGATLHVHRNTGAIYAATRSKVRKIIDNQLIYDVVNSGTVITTDKDENLYVCSDSKIYKYDRRGEQVFMYDTGYAIQGIAVDSNYNIYIAQASNGFMKLRQY